MLRSRLRGPDEREPVRVVRGPRRAEGRCRIAVPELVVACAAGRRTPPLRRGRQLAEARIRIERRARRVRDVRSETDDARTSDAQDAVVERHAEAAALPCRPLEVESEL